MKQKKKTLTMVYKGFLGSQKANVLTKQEKKREKETNKEKEKKKMAEREEKRKLVADKEQTPSSPCLPIPSSQTSPSSYPEGRDVFCRSSKHSTLAFFLQKEKRSLL